RQGRHPTGRRGCPLGQRVDVDAAGVGMAIARLGDDDALGLAVRAGDHALVGARPPGAVDLDAEGPEPAPARGLAVAARVLARIDAHELRGEARRPGGRREAQRLARLVCGRPNAVLTDVDRIALIVGEDHEVDDRELAPARLAELVQGGGGGGSDLHRGLLSMSYRYRLII